MNRYNIAALLCACFFGDALYCAEPQPRELNLFLEFVLRLDTYCGVGTSNSYALATKWYGSLQAIYKSLLRQNITYEKSIKPQNESEKKLIQQFNAILKDLKPFKARCAMYVARLGEATCSDARIKLHQEHQDLVGDMYSWTNRYLGWSQSMDAYLKRRKQEQQIDIGIGSKRLIVFVDSFDKCCRFGGSSSCSSAEAWYAGLRIINENILKQKLACEASINPEDESEKKLVRQFALTCQNLQPLKDRCERYIARLGEKFSSDTEAKIYQEHQKLVREMYDWVKDYRSWQLSASVYLQRKKRGQRLISSQASQLRREQERQGKLDAHERVRKWHIRSCSWKIQFYAEQYKEGRVPIPSKPNPLQALAIQRLAEPNCLQGLAIQRLAESILAETPTRKTAY